MPRAKLRLDDEITLPPEVVSTLQLRRGDEVDFRIGPDGVITVAAVKSVPADQAWFWTDAWRRGEAEALADVRAGRVSSYPTDDAFLADLT